MSLDVYLHTNACEHCGRSDEGYSANITHNLGRMARDAGIYYALWRPEEIGATYAKDITETVADGLYELQINPEHYAQFNAENGWGRYENFVPFVEKYLEALRQYPDAKIEVSR